MIRKLILICAVLTPSIALQTTGSSVAQSDKTPASARGSTSLNLAGLKSATRIVRDSHGIPHIFAKNDHDLYFAMGYTHSRDRFFQMDYVRRRASGTLAELLGGGGGDARLLGDIRNRSLGMRASAERSVSTGSPEHRAILQAYAAGVNAWLQGNELPLEYRVLELTKASVPEWTLVDSETIAKSFSFQFSFSNSDVFYTNVLAACEKAGKEKGFDGQKLFYDDLFGSEPFFPPTIVPRSQNKRFTSVKTGRSVSEMVGKDTQAAMDEFLNQPDDVSLLSSTDGLTGSNWWVVAGSKTNTGLPMMANDPHLEIELPSVLYEIHLNVEKGPGQAPMNVYGVSYAGAPAVIIGFNEKIAWGATTSNLDVTDVYQEQVIVDPESKAPVATVHDGKRESLTTIAQKFRVNQTGNAIHDDVLELKPGFRPTGTLVPTATYLVPRRNNGPLITAPTGSDPEKKTALSVQFQGFSPSLELETFFAWARAENMKDFERGLAYFNVGCLNWCYMDTVGNIGYFASGKVPLREDLHAGRIDGRPPFLIRDGTGAHKNDWVREESQAPAGSFVYAGLLANEMPRAVNPDEGFIVSANNDPVGVATASDPVSNTRAGGRGIYYIGRKFDAAFRAQRITELLEEKLSSRKPAKITLEDMSRIQNDVVMTDARWLTPYVLRAFEAARAASAPDQLAALAKDKAIAEAVGRLSSWDGSTPTGLPEGFDSTDDVARLSEPSQDEISRSIAATIYSVWRGQMIRNTVDAALTRGGLNRTEQSGFPSISPQHAIIALKRMFELFPKNKGIGGSGLDFFQVDGFNASAENRRDYLILKSMKDALDFLAGDNFAPAFKRSTNQSDYRWGKLHRLRLVHPLGAMGGLAAQFNAPPAAGLQDLSPDLPGVPVDGGYEVVDYSSHGPRAGSSRSFIFLSGPAMRFVIQATPRGFRGYQTFPGGPSGVPGSPYYDNMIRSWLTNHLNKIFFTVEELTPNTASIEELRPWNAKPD